MFWIFKIFPDWLWPVLLVAAIIAFFASRLVPIKAYQLPIKIVSGISIALTIFICGLHYADNTWKLAAQELQAKIQVLEAESKTANAEVETKVVTRTQIVKQRGETVVRYIDREVVKFDTKFLPGGECEMPKEFIKALNSAAKSPEDVDKKK